MFHHKALEVCPQGLAQGKSEIPEDIAADITVTEDENVCISYRVKTLLGSFVGRVLSEAIVRA